MQRSAKYLLKIDSNSDGLDIAEFREFLRSQLSGPELQELDECPMSTVKSWFDCLDKGGDGHVSKADLFGFMLKQATMASGHNNVTALLKSFPELTRGLITLPKFSSVVIQLGFDNATADQIMTEMDKDKSGGVNFAELDLWCRSTMKNGEIKLFDGTRPLDRLSNILERGRVRQAKRRTRAHAERKQIYGKICQEHPHVMEAQRKLGLVIPTDEDRTDAVFLGEKLISKIDAMLKEPGGPNNLIEILEAWDIDGNGCLTLKEFHQALALIGITDSTAAATQVLFDTIDIDASFTLTFSNLVAFIQPGEAS